MTGIGGEESSSKHTAGTQSRVSRVREALLDWYAERGRELPWRETRDPYAILVSEVMLQQTQASRVAPRWLAWLERWPTAESLAAAPTGDVIREWQGLGYNRRALSLQRAARVVAERGWPDDLTELPGVGPLHRRRCRLLRPRPAGAAGGRERPPHSGAHRRGVRPHLRAGADGPGRDDLHRADPALRRVPARLGLSLARHAASSRCASKARSKARSGSGGRGRCGSWPSHLARSPSLDAEAVRALERDELVLVEDELVRLPA